MAQRLLNQVRHENTFKPYTNSLWTDLCIDSSGIC